MATQSLRHAIARKWSAQTAEDLEDNLRKIFANLGVLNTAAAASNQSSALVPSVGDLMACLTTAGVFALLPIVTTDQRALVNNGGVPGWGQIKLATGVTGTLPLANLVNASATQRLLGRNSAGAGVFQEVTLTQLLDWIGAAAQGDILFRGAAGWQRLGAGAVSTFLQSNGAAADLSYAVPTGSGGIADFIQQQFLFCSGVVGGGSPNANMYGWGHSGGASVGASPTADNDSSGSYIAFTQTGTSINLRAGFDASRRDYFRADENPTLEFVIKTGATLTNIRLWFLMSDTQISSADDLGGTSKYMGFRYSTVAGDGGWVGVTRDGTTQAVTATVATIAGSTVYKLKIRKSGSTVFFSVNGGAEVSTASNLPAAATQFGIDGNSITSSAGALHPFSFSRYRCLFGS